ncbi:MAG: HAMP domain-containing protein, partial [Rhodospirillaceae bacterium]
MISWMARFQIGPRIVAAFALLTALLIIVGLVGRNGLLDSAALQDGYVHLSNQVGNILEIKNKISIIRRNVLLHAFSGDSLADDAAIKMTGNVQEALKTLAPTFRNAERRASAEKILGLIGSYSANIIEVTKEKETKDSRLAELMTTGNSMTRALTEVFDRETTQGNFETATRLGAALQTLLSARIAALRFVGNSDPGLIPGVHNAVAGAEASLAAARDHAGPTPLAGQIQQIQAGTGRYLTLFDALAEATRAYTDLVQGAMKRQAEEIDGLAQSLSASLEADLGRNDQDTDLAIHSAVTGVTILLIAATLISALAAWLTTIGIVRPVTAMTGAMTRLAGGDQTVTVPARDHQDEIGAMADAVQVFKDNALAMERMRADQERQ